MFQVKVSEGVIEGEEVQNKHDNGRTFSSFKGIPYAEPPVGELRFKAPQPPKPWKGIRSAKAFGPICYQQDLFKILSPQGSEDCLYLNVYTPDLNPAEPLPVMFWIHGGGFVTGSGNDDLYAPEYLVKQGVVLVTINYRLEVLGFLCLDTEEVPGNAGMKDQVAALRWVNKNIRSFGGDPDNVTIFGESAGGACVGYHLVSPMTKGLFKKAILQSGAMTCWWSYTTDPKDKALTLARKLGFTSESERELCDFFRALPVESLTQHESNTAITFAEKGKSKFVPPFSIVDEKNFGNNERFFYGSFGYDNLVNKIHNGVEIFLGFTKDEGLICLTIGQDLENKLKQMNSFYEEFVPNPIDYKCLVPERLEVGKKLKKLYFGKKTSIEMEDWKRIVKFYSMDYFVYGTIELAKMVASLKKNKLYLYQFSCMSERNQFANFLQLGTVIRDEKVVCHCDDLLYLFSGRWFEEFSRDPLGIQLVHTVTKIWTDIAKNGNPTPVGDLEGVKWPQYTLKNQEYLDIGNEIQIKTVPYEEEIQLWEDIHRKYAPDFVFRP